MPTPWSARSTRSSRWQRVFGSWQGGAERTHILARILIVPVPEYGHISPTLPLAKSLCASGHAVTYLTDHQFGAVIEGAGCQLLPLLAARPDLANASGDHIWNAFAPRTGVGLRANRLRGLVHDAVDSLRPDFILFDRHVASNKRFPMTALVDPRRYLRYATSLPDWTETLEDTGEASPMLVFCPEVFELQPFRRPARELLYGEASIDTTSMNGVEDIPCDRTRPIILVAFGTQTIKYPHLAAQLDLIFRVAQKRTEFDFVIATGAASDTVSQSTEHRGDNLFVRKSIPQQAWMKHASVFIGHGGLGGIKEAILQAVPMIVLPMIQDQPYNAMRVRELGLGTAIFPPDQSESVLGHDLVKAAGGAFAGNLSTMQETFCRLEAERPLLAIITEKLGLY